MMTIPQPHRFFAIVFGASLPSRRWYAVAVAVLVSCGAGLPSTAKGDQPAEITWRLVQSIAAEEAFQAAAANESHLFAITNTKIGKYDRTTGQRVAISTGPAKHLNSGFFWQGRLLAAHSNYPSVPEQSQILQLDVDTMKLTLFHDFRDYGGSLTWIVHHADHWWCHFAKYGDDNHGSFLVKFNERWEERNRWTLPPNLVKELGRYSLSGGLWIDQHLYVTGHDEKSLYRLRVPLDSSVLDWVATEAAPFTGQGIAIDPVTPDSLIGIDRRNRRLLIATRNPAAGR